MVALGKTSNGCEDQAADGAEDREQSKGGKAADQRPVSGVLADQEDENQDKAVDNSGDHKLLFVFITQHDAGNAPGHKRPPTQEEGVCCEDAEDRCDDGGFEDDGSQGSIVQGKRGQVTHVLRKETGSERFKVCFLSQHMSDLSPFSYERRRRIPMSARTPVAVSTTVEGSGTVPASSKAALNVGSVPPTMSVPTRSQSGSSIISRVHACRSGLKGVVPGPVIGF